MSYYTLPTLNETGGFYGVFKFIGGDPTGGLFWISMLFVIWIISFIATKQYTSSRAWTFSSFFCAILSIFLSVMEYISPKWMYLLIVMTLIGFVWLKLEDS